MSDETPAPSKEINAATCALSQDALIECGDLLASLARSCAEAAFRGSHQLCRLHLLECRDVLKHAAECLRSWEAASSEGGGG
jgi:hypothetical protein